MAIVSTSIILTGAANIRQWLFTAGATRLSSSSFWRGCTKKGAIAGFISGGITVVVWICCKSVSPIFGIYEILPAFIINLIVTFVVSRIDKNKDAEMLAKFDEYKKAED